MDRIVALCWIAGLATPLMLVATAFGTALHPRPPSADEPGWWLDRLVLWLCVLTVASWYAYANGWTIGRGEWIAMAVAVAALVVRAAVPALRRGLRGTVRLADLLALAGLALCVALAATALWRFRLPLESLPVAVSGNHDVFSYANNALIIGDDWPGAADAMAGTPMREAIRRDVFGAFVFLGWIATLLDMRPIEAAGVAELVAAIMIGLALLQLLRGVFALPWLMAAVVAAVALTNPVFLFIRFGFYLGQLLHYALFLGLVLTTIAAHRAGRLGFVEMLLRAVPYYLLNLFVYPPTLLPTVLLHLLLIVVLAGAARRPSSLADLGRLARSLLWLPALPLAGGLALAVMVPERASLSVMQVTGLAAADVGAWPLSQFKLLGFPGLPDPWRALPLADLAVPFLVVAAAIAALLGLWRHRTGTAPPAITLLVLLLGAYAAFVIVNLVGGDTYQSFKLGTFYVPVLTVALPGALWALAAASGRRRMAGAVVLACAAVVAVNVGGGLRRHFMTVPRDMAALAAIDRMSGIDVLLVQGLSFPETMLIRQYVTRQRLQLGQPTYYAGRPIAPAEVAPARPVLTTPAACLAGAPGVVTFGRFALAGALPPPSAASGDDACAWMRRDSPR